MTPIHPGPRMRAALALATASPGISRDDAARALGADLDASERRQREHGARALDRAIASGLVLNRDGRIFPGDPDARAERAPMRAGHTRPREYCRIPSRDGTRDVLVMEAHEHGPRARTYAKIGAASVPRGAPAPRLRRDDPAVLWIRRDVRTQERAEALEQALAVALKARELARREALTPT